MRFPCRNTPNSWQEDAEELVGVHLRLRSRLLIKPHSLIFGYRLVGDAASLSYPFTEGPISLTCRARRIKCDEKKPICTHCDRRGIECRQADVIVHDAQSSLSQARRPSSGAARQVNAAQVLGYEPESTNDVVQRVQLGSPNQLQPPPPTSTHHLRLSKQCIDLVQMYQDGIGIWMDVCDDTLTYQRHVVRLALSSELLLHSICALSAKQMSLVKERYLWDPVAADYYGTSLRLLVRDLDRSDVSRDTTLAAAILLCSYELLANPGTEYKRHLLGARTLIQTYRAMNGATDVERASFWIFARQDVAMAIMNETQTLIHPNEWAAAVDRLGNGEDSMGNKIIWLLARTVQLRFSSNDKFGSEPSALDDVSSAIDQWWCDLPPTTHGIRIEGESEDGATEIWFHAPSTGQPQPLHALRNVTHARLLVAASLLYYHMAKILLLELEFEVQNSGRHNGHRLLGPINGDLREKLESHALSIASICLSRHMWEGVRSIAVNPMFYGKSSPQYSELLTLQPY